MKLSILLILLASILSVPLAYAQKSQKAFFYKATYTSDSTNRENIGTDLMVLWVGDQYSVFESYYGFQIDSVVLSASSTIENPNQANIGMVMGKVNSMKKSSYKFLIHKSFEEGEILVYDKLFFDNYKYTEPLSVQKWKIGNQTKTILGFKCQSATQTFSGRTFIAWFTEQIPISDGPYVFNGLPGLILQIEDDKRYFNFELVGIENSEIDMETRVLKNSISLDKKGYFSLKKEMYKDIRKALVGKQAGSIDDKTTRELQNRYDRINNPLELKVK